MKTIEDIYEAVEFVGIDTFGEVQGLISKTISRLPVELQERVVDDVIFISADSYGLYHRYHLPLYPKKDMFDFIILNLSSIEDQEEKMFVIAHEIAHFILGHYMHNPDITEDSDIETEADSLVEQWGFTVPERRRDK